LKVNETRLACRWFNIESRAHVGSFLPMPGCRAMDIALVSCG